MNVAPKYLKILRTRAPAGTGSINAGTDPPSPIAEQRSRKSGRCRRKRCLECSPFGAHNNTHTSPKPYRCPCGETDPNKFYGNKRSICAKCHCAYTRAKNRENREFVRATLGSICKRCQFDGPTCCYDVHHPDPTQKDPDFIRMRNWSKVRILAEIVKCHWLCKNCHAIVHYAE